MKKIILAVFLIAGAVSLNAQDTTKHHKKMPMDTSMNKMKMKADTSMHHKMMKTGKMKKDSTK